ncbi:phosphotransferase enzyme family protein [Zymomonas mobilis]|uniref:phosphotransferase enzyme family protein n=1 Tax=Zymomonas mobilis TaxID=542 RepID=UPI0003C7674F|nr:phosphotransferase [Zymomonas mobilis]AHB11015.1 putative homoserine kinase type II (protein kinase fold) [Zymomonas mobilis subsp. mobilis str. CP4 = NRRL B-14023]AHJ71330.1 serine/threonine protein kinase [Zymomonas mobilis subsp. mobilis NRRL B-12526]AHJ73183.1 serine/threonine protein kinase [Zymomonas mobilis subsp. mobilis str. CP4 = NRRL B-14023]TWE24734.1 Ser/Thr protein kinase RdoA (MazF antagonist) [Zymomonas mobilis]
MNSRHADNLDTSILSQLAAQAMEAYPQAYQGKIRLLTRSENATFHIAASSGENYALRLHRPHYHDKQSITGELAWLKALQEDIGLTVPQAIPDRDGEVIQTLKAPDGALRYAVLFNWVEGEMPTADLDPSLFQRLGEVTAHLHQHSQRWEKPDNFKRLIWNHANMVGADGYWGDWRATPGLDSNGIAIMREAMGQIGQSLEKFGQSSDRYGLIHADLRLTNILIHEGDTRAIDFDDCGTGWFLHDLAAAISFEEHHPAAPLWVENWLKGYDRVQSLSREEIDILPALFAQRRIQMTAWVGSHADTDMARSLGGDWLAHTVRLCRDYLDGKTPLGAA